MLFWKISISRSGGWCCWQRFGQMYLFPVRVHVTAPLERLRTISTRIQVFAGVQGHVLLWKKKIQSRIFIWQSKVLIKSKLPSGKLLSWTLKKKGYINYNLQKWEKNKYLSRKRCNGVFVHREYFECAGTWHFYSSAWDRGSEMVGFSY